MQIKKKDLQLNDDLSFLIACCQTELTKDDTSFILSYLNAERLNLNDLISLAHQHGILPLVYKTIKNIVENDSSHSFLNTEHLTPNAEILTVLKAHYMSISQINMLMSAELIRIMKLLNKNGIHALAFKGPTLAQIAYGDITLRQYSDLDIFIHKNNIMNVTELLENNHYNSVLNFKYFSNEKFLNLNNDCQFYHEKNNILIEIHWMLFRNTFSKSIKKINLWTNPKKVFIQNYELSTFKIEILLLYLCIHGSKHGWSRIEWILDVDKIIRISENIDWKDVYKLANISNGKKMLELGLVLAFHLFSTPLPEDIQNKVIQNKKISQLSFNILKMINEQKYFLDSKLQKHIHYFRVHLALKNTILEKIKYLFTIFLPLNSRDVELINLPKKLYFIYYFLRPFRLLYKYIIKVFNLVNIKDS